MPGDPGQRFTEIADVDAAEAGEPARMVDQQLIPDAARVAIHHMVSGKIKTRTEVSNDVFGVVGDAAALVIVDDGDNVAVDSVAVNRAVFGDS